MYGFIPLENRIVPLQNRTLLYSEFNKVRFCNGIVLPSEFRKIGFSNGIYILIISVPLTKGGRGLFQ